MNRRRLMLALLCLFAIPLVIVSARGVAHAVSGGDFTYFSAWIQFRSNHDGKGQGGLSIGPTKAVPGTKVTGKYAVFVTLDPPSLATTCTNDYFTNNPAMSATYNFGTQPDGSAITGLLGQLALTDACVVSAGTNQTAALQQSCRVSTAGGGVDNTAVVEVKTCTFGTINGASQKMTLSFEHYK